VVFCDENTGACKGILFQYDNGGARAVGQCRLQVDPAEEVAHPMHFCFKIDSSYLRINRTLYAVRVKFKQTPPSGSTIGDGEGWTSHQMRGILKFWFSPASCFVAIED
jgi:hypothetical protein